MSEYIHLVGAEQVQSAANTMSYAADEMKRAAANLDQSLFQQRQFMDEWLVRLQAIMEANQRSER